VNKFVFKYRTMTQLMTYEVHCSRLSVQRMSTSFTFI